MRSFAVSVIAALLSRRPARRRAGIDAVPRAPERRATQREHRHERRRTGSPTRSRTRGRRTTAGRAEQMAAYRPSAPSGVRKTHEADRDVVAARGAHERQPEGVDPDRQRREEQHDADDGRRRLRARARRAASGIATTANTASVDHDATTIAFPVTPGNLPGSGGQRGSVPAVEKSPRVNGNRRATSPS